MIFRHERIPFILRHYTYVDVVQKIFFLNMRFFALVIVFGSFLCSFAYHVSRGTCSSSPPEVRRFQGWRSIQRSFLRASSLQRDELGYEIKPRDWFNGLSTDPGASLTDPRAVPPACKEFAEQIKSNTRQVTLAETIKFIDEHYNYFAVSIFLNKF